MKSLASTCATSLAGMPSVGLGTYMIAPDQIQQAIHSAIAVGYRRIDCAPVYFNEAAIGDALQQEFMASATASSSKDALTRDQLFVTSKLPGCFHRPQHVELAVKKSLADLRLEYLDLYLIHWPVAMKYVEIDFSQRGWPDEAIDDGGGGSLIDPTVSIHDTWRAMEGLVERGLVRHIGVSNVPVALLHELMTRASIPPAVNQVELHPYLQQSKLLNYCHARGIHVQAYAPLGTPGVKESDEPVLLDDPLLTELSTSKNITVAQLCLAWALQRGTSVVAKSASPTRQAENIQSATYHNSDDSTIPFLTDDEMKRISQLDRHYRFFR
eukprot:CAMPEP_0198294656 /NCGR_PEP_ID=MMETSP1449-20131203/23516_1 /TAXON_ID=420275 /ORGANISM="Attheya septentrionalis, Strain CCMP2084" /LENGTH=325 /DNA_ID=CAMNT_0043994671 /DNA_START=183 /DNA_END=1156 /DNA_ORIENTATION=+